MTTTPFAERLAELHSALNDVRDAFVAQGYDMPELPLPTTTEPTESASPQRTKENP